MPPHLALLTPPLLTPQTFQQEQWRLGAGAQSCTRPHTSVQLHKSTLRMRPHSQVKSVPRKRTVGQWPTFSSWCILLTFSSWKLWLDWILSSCSRCLSSSPWNSFFFSSTAPLSAAALRTRTSSSTMRDYKENMALKVHIISQDTAAPSTDLTGPKLTAQQIQSQGGWWVQDYPEDTTGTC